jgi:amino acid permease
VPLLQTGKKRNDDISEIRFAVITTAIIILSYIVAMTVSSLEAVLAYVGSTGSTSISFILPGLFYYKISSPDSPLHQQLVKEEDDYDVDEEDGDSSEEEGLLGGSGVLSASGVLKRSNLKVFRRQLLRKLSLALAIYGIIVMITCVTMNTFFLVSH